MIEMDGRDSAQCQNWEKKGRRCHFGIVNEENDKKANSAHLLPQIEDKNVEGRRGCSEVQIFISRERESHFSLDLRAIGPSKSFGPRRKAALRGEAYAWTPVLGSFVKLREVGVSSYLSFTLYLSVI